ncbi:MAG: cyclic diguanosine monophosphate-binding protein [marine bacterium B5-7]|nr:MAG: cyclic diguanosine monophosphate-binding protein [marine bacterium B5-7]
MKIKPVFTDKRRFSRIAFDAPVTIHSNDGNWESSLIDISLKGVLIAKPNNWDYPDKEEFKISVELEGHDSIINMSAKQVHTGDKTLGLQCISIDLKSVAILKRLVELNLGDETILDREITNMMACQS